MAKWFELWEKQENVFYGKPYGLSKRFAKHVIAVKKLISGSPLSESKGIMVPHLEKMLVDIYCDWKKFGFDKNYKYQVFFRKAYINYSINKSKLLRYAGRRKKKKAFEKLLKGYYKK